MATIKVPQIEGPTAQLCYIGDLRMSPRCDRKRGHKGPHSWEVMMLAKDRDALLIAAKMALNDQMYKTWPAVADALIAAIKGR